MCVGWGRDAGSGLGNIHSLDRHLCVYDFYHSTRTLLTWFLSLHTNTTLLTHWGRDNLTAISQLDDAFKRIFLNENFLISTKISLKFVPKGPINNIPALVQIMDWHRPGDTPLSEAVMVKLLTHICVARPQWVNHWSLMVPVSVWFPEPAWGRKWKQKPWNDDFYHHKSQLRDSWCTSRPLTSCFNPKFLDQSVPHEAKAMGLLRW